jgi:radical SAM protein with 4Fe4S-binding SPASM domain
VTSTLKPQIITLEITQNCNRFCSYCYNHLTTHEVKKKDEKPPLGFVTLMKLVTNLVLATKAHTIQIAGGEPLLHPNLLDFVGEITEMKKRCTLLTDGGLISSQRAKALKKAGIKLVQPTLLAGNRDLHDHIKGVPSFDDTLRGIRYLKEAKIPVSVAFVAMRENCDYFKEVIELCFALGIRSLAFSRYVSSGDAIRDKKLTPSRDQIRSCLKIAQWANKTLGMKVVVAISLPHCITSDLSIEDLPMGGCSLGGTNFGLTLDSFGNLRACAVSATIMGNMQEKSLTEILNFTQNEYLPKVRALPQICIDCDLKESCHGGCRESAIKTGDIASIDPLLT